MLTQTDPVPVTNALLLLVLLKIIRQLPPAERLCAPLVQVKLSTIVWTGTLTIALRSCDVGCV